MNPQDKHLKGTIKRNWQNLKACLEVHVNNCDHKNRKKNQDSIPDCGNIIEAT